MFRLFVPSTKLRAVRLVAAHELEMLAALWQQLPEDDEREKNPFLHEFNSPARKKERKNNFLADDSCEKLHGDESTLEWQVGSGAAKKNYK